MTFHRIWGQATAFLHASRRVGWIDILVIAGLAGLLVAVVELSRQWTAPSQAAVEIDLAPTALVGYTLLSLSRGLLAYVLSLAFTLAYGTWAAKDHRAERVLVPLLDVLQSIPVLGFMPGLVLTLVAVFPRSNIGLELAAVIMIFTGQAWNMTFSFYHSLRSIPADLREVATLAHFSPAQRFRWLEVPFSMMGLVWNSMMSMAGGWFFLMINEAFRLGDRDFRLPGVGAYMSVAVERGRTDAMLWAVLAMVVMVVALDQLLWRPVVVWAQKFRVEEGGYQAPMSSWFLDLLKQSRLLSAAERVIAAMGAWWPRRVATEPAGTAKRRALPVGSVLSPALLVVLLIALALGAWRLTLVVVEVSAAEWLATFESALWTLARVLTSTALGTLWAVPAGLAIGLSERLSRVLQPVVQVVASFPAPMLFPAVIALLHVFGVSLSWGSILLMLLGTQWYILFNVTAGEMAIPADLKEAARSYRFSLFQRMRALYLPAVFPYLVTGWITAAGGAWNASIVAEYVTFRGEVLTAPGLGAQISEAASQANFPLLAASILVMSLVVVAFNRLVWQRCYKLAEERFSLNK